MWLLNSSIGRKVIMSISGLFLVFFLLFHSAMNLVAVFSASGYNAVCEFLGTNPIVQFMVPVLALGFVVHIVYAIWLTIRNRKARGADRYAVTGRSDVSWSSKNMLVLGIVVLGFLAWHLDHFWSKMQLQEWTGNVASEGFALVKITFARWWVVLLYIVWIAALWLHLSHGFWSAFQSIGINNTVWYKRWKVIGICFATLVCLMFIFVAVAFLLHNMGMWPSVGNMWHLGAHAPEAATLPAI